MEFKLEVNHLNPLLLEDKEEIIQKFREELIQKPSKIERNLDLNEILIHGYYKKDHIKELIAKKI